MDMKRPTWLQGFLSLLAMLALLLLYLRFGLQFDESKKKRIDKTEKNKGKSRFIDVYQAEGLDQCFYVELVLPFVNTGDVHLRTFRSSSSRSTTCCDAFSAHLNTLGTKPKTLLPPFLDQIIVPSGLQTIHSRPCALPKGWLRVEMQALGCLDGVGTKPLAEILQYHDPIFNFPFIEEQSFSVRRY